MELKPHVVMVPLPFQGHIKPFLCLAQLLSQTGLYITFVNTRYNHKRFSNLSALSLQFPNLQFESISDGMPDEDDQPRSLTFDFFYGLKYQSREHLKELIGTLSRRSENAQSPPITCIIGDGSVSFPVDVAEELGIPVISFCCHSAHYLLANICIPKLIEDGQLPYHEEKDTNHRINIEVAGLELEGRLRLKDLPDFCVLKDVNDPAYQFFVNEALAMTRSSGVIFNTADDLEAPCLPTIANICGRAYTIGPLHALLNSQIGHNRSQLTASHGSLWKTKHDCMTWLDSQPSRSVLYVSFGSLVKTSSAQLLEIWNGLVDSGYSFLWAVRPDMVDEENDNGIVSFPKVLEIGPKERGYIVDWAPQERVLAHDAVGGFLTHGGWNSILESILAGVPMIGWPNLGDQRVDHTENNQDIDGGKGGVSKVSG
ncbi:7-deoxyloganetic acid glucosyltransferase [Ziziphus jujuba]|uniref:Glycosyltransferase n=1 Tax=Ziziphus jujuba TaxID=326968 RepID=A0A6P6GKI3_ZIZJJ|nr:7-deoxyloganetic acid glucosyltransferase [Ziziphus jujuba]